LLEGRERKKKRERKRRRVFIAAIETGGGGGRSSELKRCQQTRICTNAKRMSRKQISEATAGVTSELVGAKGETFREKREFENETSSTESEGEEGTGETNRNHARQNGSGAVRGGGREELKGMRAETYRNARDRDQGEGLVPYC